MSKSKIRRIAAMKGEPVPEFGGSCEWRESGTEYESEGWETSCGNMFVLNDGTPKQNDMAFCCYCGKPLVERQIYAAPAALPDGYVTWLESQDFYELCQAYRHAKDWPHEGMQTAAEAFEELKREIRKHAAAGERK